MRAREAEKTAKPLARAQTHNKYINNAHEIQKAHTIEPGAIDLTFKLKQLTKRCATMATHRSQASLSQRIVDDTVFRSFFLLLIYSFE